MVNSGYVPTVRSLGKERVRELEEKYGEVIVLDALPFISGLTETMPESAPCGCSIGRTIANKLVRAREQYQDETFAGRHLYSLLGKLCTESDGPLSMIRFDNGCVVMVIPEDVAKTNPVMAIKDGVVSVTGRGTVNDGFALAGQSKHTIERMAEAAIEKRGAFRFVESVKGGTTITMNSLHSNDYLIVHLKSRCRIMRNAKGVENCGPDQGDGAERHRRRRRRHSRTEHSRRECSSERGYQTAA